MEVSILVILVSLLGITVTGTTIVVYAQNATGSFFDSVTELSNTIFLVAIPAVTGLVIAIGSALKMIVKNKKFDEGFEVAKNGMMMATTFGQKTNDMLKQWGPFIEIGLKNLPQEQQDRLKQVGLTIDDIEAMIEASADQLNKLREKVPSFADPDKLPMLREQDILRAKRASRSRGGDDDESVDAV